MGCYMVIDCYLCLVAVSEVYVYVCVCVSEDPPTLTPHPSSWVDTTVLVLPLAASSARAMHSGLSGPTLWHSR